MLNQLQCCSGGWSISQIYFLHSCNAEQRSSSSNHPSPPPSSSRLGDCYALHCGMDNGGMNCFVCLIFVHNLVRIEKSFTK